MKRDSKLIYHPLRQFIVVIIAFQSRKDSYYSTMDGLYSRVIDKHEYHVVVYLSLQVSVLCNLSDAHFFNFAAYVLHFVNLEFNQLIALRITII